MNINIKITLIRFQKMDSILFFTKFYYMQIYNYILEIR